MRARRIKSFCVGAKTLLFKGERESRPCGLRRTAHPRSDAAPPRARAVPGAHRTPPCVATDVCTRVRTLYALLMRARHIKSFCGGAKTLLFKGEREVGNAPTPPFQRDAASAASQSATTNAPTSPTQRTAHIKSCCPSAEHARDPRKRAMPETCNPAPKIKAFGRIRAQREQFQ